VVSVVGLNRMETVRGQSCECPHCLGQLKIASLKFSFSRTRVVFACPNCARMFAEEGLEQRGVERVRNFAKPVGALLRRTLDMMETLNARFRYVIVSMIVALTVAAVLRHSVHTYAGFSREAIREGALVMCAVISLGLIIWRYRQRR
jgi:hypothetical protein